MVKRNRLDGPDVVAHIRQGYGSPDNQAADTRRDLKYLDDLVKWSVWSFHYLDDRNLHIVLHMCLSD